MKTYIKVLALLALLQLASAASLTTTIEPAVDESWLTIEEGRVVGGMETSILNFPHQLSLQMEHVHICGASVLSAYIALSAAHCVTAYGMPQLYSVRAGSSNWSYGGIVIPIRRIIPHQQFQQPMNDIALLALARPLVFNEYIQPIPLATSLDNVPLTYAVSGWGTLNEESDAKAPRLRYTVVQLMDWYKCASAYMGMAVVTDSMFCAGMPQGGRDSCKGDSGGSLVSYTNGVLKQYGVVSFGIGCGRVEHPGVYTKISAYSQWIAETISVI